MKTYNPVTIYKDGTTFKFKKPYKQLKRALEMGALIYRNQLVERVDLLTQEYGEHEHAGEYTDYTTVIPRPEKK